MPWTMENVPPPARKWTKAEKERCIIVANRVLSETKDEQKAIFAYIGAVKQMRQKSEVEKANHAYAKCMLCKENPPDNDALWQDGDGVLHRAWSCNKCYPSWYAEKGEMVIHVHKVDGVAPSRYRPIRHSPKEGRKKLTKDSRLRINGVEVDLQTLAKSWLALRQAQDVLGQPREAEAAPIEAQEEIEKQEVVLNCEIIKADKKRHTVTSVVLQPEKRDAQKDTVSEDDILDAIHGYMIRSRAIDYRHKEVLPFTKAVPVEIYAAPMDFEIGGHPVKKGAWVMTTKILDAELWKEVEKGNLRAYSIKGWGKRQKVT